MNGVLLVTTPEGALTVHAAASVLQKCLSGVLSTMHAYRRRALLGAVQSLLCCRRLILMEMARAWPGAQRVRAPLKRLDRLLSNRHLAQERECLYASMTRWLIRQPHPLILIDWSDLHEDCRWHLLRASIPISGRAFTVLEMVFAQSLYGSPRAEKQFLRRLHALLPAQVRPILVSDAGFRTPWLRLVRKYGWYYVGRLRGHTHLQLTAHGEWFDNRQLHRRASRTAQRLEDVKLVVSQPWQLDLVLYRKAPQGRVRLSVRNATRSRRITSLQAQRRESEPWLLVVSPELRHLSAQQVVSIYSKRMQIEQSFRDLKCDRFGCAFRYSLTREPQRIAILLLIHALASFLAWLAALLLAIPTLVRYGGVKSPRPRLHYSQLRIGWEAFRRHDLALRSSALYQLFQHPPASFLSLLEIPT
jgi:hypothetical protein